MTRNEDRVELSDIIKGVEPRRVYVIAEIGSNHGGSLDRALAYIDACAQAGANAVKFQSWNTVLIQNRVDPDTGKLHPAYPIFEKYELATEWHGKLKARCDDNRLDFLATPFDLERANLLRKLGVPAIKIASGDLTFIQLLKEVGCYGLPVLLSTGMAIPEEIKQALEALGSEAKKQTILLHCVGAYPPAFEDANLRAIQTLAETFGLPVGISDHYPGYTTVIAAISLGAQVVEKHVTFSRDHDTPDSPFALEMDEFRNMVEQIRILEKALGDGVKQCRASEAGGLIGGRRSLYWNTNMSTGNKVSESNISIVRPNKGVFQPGDIDEILGRKLVRSVTAGSLIQKQDFEII